MAVKEIKVEVMNDKGELVVFKNNFIPARKVREALQINVMAEDGEHSELDIEGEMLTFVVSLFKGLTEDMVLDGVASWDYMPFLQNTIGDVLGADPKQTANS